MKKIQIHFGEEELRALRPGGWVVRKERGRDSARGRPAGLAAAQIPRADHPVGRRATPHRDRARHDLRRAV